MSGEIENVQITCPSCGITAAVQFPVIYHCEQKATAHTGIECDCGEKFGVKVKHEGDKIEVTFEPYGEDVVATYKSPTVTDWWNTLEQARQLRPDLAAQGMSLSDAREIVRKSKVIQ